jgi:hypothetical protein
VAPRISVALAVYNGARFIRQQLDSLTRQERRPDEVVISDDGSSDRTVEIVREFAASAPFAVRVLSNRDNVGCTKNFERAINDCSGDIIFLCDCDDVWYPAKIAIMEETFRVHARAGVAVCDADLADAHMCLSGRRLWSSRNFQPPKRWKRLADGQEFDRSIPCYGPTIAFRGHLKSLVLPLPDGAVFRLAGQDTFITWCIVGGGAGGVALIDMPLLAYRQHPEQMTKQFNSAPMPRWASRSERPFTFLLPLIERLESAAAKSVCVNPGMREAALRHWRSRVFLPPGKLKRMPTIARELASGRYWQFSDGLVTTAKDLLFVR